MGLNSDQLNSDQLNIDTPELVSIEMPLAGIGSRFIALLLDSLIWAAGLLVLSLLLWAFFARTACLFQSLLSMVRRAIYLRNLPAQLGLLHAV